MASTSVIAVPSASAWVKIVDAADANICLQNVGSVHVVAVAADSAPDANSTSGFNLLSNSGLLARTCQVVVFGCAPLMGSVR